jgi:hypothetical protein
MIVDITAEYAVASRICTDAPARALIAHLAKRYYDPCDTVARLLTPRLRDAQHIAFCAHVLDGFRPAELHRLAAGLDEGTPDPALLELIRASVHLGGHRVREALVSEAMRALPLLDACLTHPVPAVCELDLDEICATLQKE